MRYPMLTSMQDILPPDVPIISVSKGLEVGSGKMMSEVIPSALGRKQPAAFLSGPSFAKEIMDLRPTGVVAASKVTIHLLYCSASHSAQLVALSVRSMTLQDAGDYSPVIKCSLLFMCRTRILPGSCKASLPAHTCGSIPPLM